MNPYDESGPTAAVEFDWDKVDPLCGEKDGPEYNVIRDQFLSILNWVDKGAGSNAKMMRLRVVRWILDGCKNQAESAFGVGATRAAHSKLANNFVDEFKLPKIGGMRPETKDTMAAVTSAYHHGREQV